MFRNHVPPNFEGVRRRNSVWGLHRYAGTAGTRRESRAPEHSLLPAYARGARRNMSDFVLSDFEDEDAAGGCFDSDDEVEERVAARESMDEDSDDEDVDRPRRTRRRSPRRRPRRRPSRPTSSAELRSPSHAERQNSRLTTLGRLSNRRRPARRSPEIRL